MTQPPWASGPSEILQHGLSLLRKESDSNRRLAMISIDNAVELTIKTYLSLPRRITGINLSRKEFQEISESFPQLLDALEKHSSDKLSGIDLGEIEWFHRLRNQLYHQGNGLTVEKDKIEIYAELAKLLFQNLFGFNVQIEENGSRNLLGNFLETWIYIEQKLSEITTTNIEKLTPKYQAVVPLRSTIVAKQLAKAGVISLKTATTIDELREIRNRVLHSTDDFRKLITNETINKAKLVLNELEN